MRLGKESIVLVAALAIVVVLYSGIVMADEEKVTYVDDGSAGDLYTLFIKENENAEFIPYGGTDGQFSSLSSVVSEINKVTPNGDYPQFKIQVNGNIEFKSVSADSFVFSYAGAVTVSGEGPGSSLKFSAGYADGDSNYHLQITRGSLTLEDLTIIGTNSVLLDLKGETVNVNAGATLVSESSDVIHSAVNINYGNGQSGNGKDLAVLNLNGGVIKVTSKSTNISGDYAIQVIHGTLNLNDGMAIGEGPEDMVGVNVYNHSDAILNVSYCEFEGFDNGMDLLTNANQYGLNDYNRGQPTITFSPLEERPLSLEWVNGASGRSYGYPTVLINEPFADGSSIGVSAVGNYNDPMSGVIVTLSDTIDNLQSQYFHSDGRYTVQYGDTIRFFSDKYEAIVLNGERLVSFGNLTNMLSLVQSGYTLCVLKDITLTGPITLPAVDWTLEGNGNSISFTGNGPFIKISSGDVTIKHLTINGRSGQITFEVTGGILNLGSEATIRNGGMGIFVNKGNVNILDGATISGHTGLNRYVYGSTYTGAAGIGIFGGNVTMSGGTISGNSSTSNNGAIYSWGGTVNLQGGSIINNSGSGLFRYNGTGTLTIGGGDDPEPLVMTGNRNGNTTSNLRLESSVFSIVGDLAEGSIIGVYTSVIPSSTDVRIGTGGNSVDQDGFASCFRSDRSVAGGWFSGDILYLSLKSVDDLYVSVNGSDTAGNGTRDNPFRTISHAYSVASAAGGNRSIILLSDITLTSAMTLNGSRNNITITSDAGEEYTIYRGSVTATDLITITNSARVTFENITIDGSGMKEKNSLLVTNGGVLTLESGSTVQNGGSGVWVVGPPNVAGAKPTLNIRDGALITNNTGHTRYVASGYTTTVGGVGLNGAIVLEMTGGTISNNTGSYAGGMAFVHNDVGSSPTSSPVSSPSSRESTRSGTSSSSTDGGERSRRSASAPPGSSTPEATPRSSTTARSRRSSTRPSTCPWCPPSSPSSTARTCPRWS